MKSDVEFHVLSSDVYQRFHQGGGQWFYAHQSYGGGMKARQNTQNWQTTYGLVVSQDAAVETFGLVRWDYVYSNDDGSAKILGKLTAFDKRFCRDGLPNPEETD